MIELYIEHSGELYLPTLINKVTWETDRKGSPGLLKFETYGDGAELDEGNAISFRVDGQPVFYGFIFTRSFKGDGVWSVTAYDQLIYLKKNKASYVFEKETASEKIRQIAEDFRLSIGAIDNSAYRMSLIEDDKTLIDIISEALQQTLEHSKKLYCLYDDYGKLMLTEVNKMLLDIMIDTTAMTSYDYSSTIDGEVYNKIKLAYDNESSGKRETFIAQSGENMNKWGILQYYKKIDNPDDAKTQANALLSLHNRALKTLSLETLGDIRVRGGSSIAVKLAIGTENVNQYMLVDKVVHTFEGNKHTMKLNVRGGEIASE